MIEVAKSKAGSRKSNPKVLKMDMREIKLPRRYDAVMALFIIQF